MKKTLLLCSVILLSNSFAKESLQPQQIYAKKCAMCHHIDKGDIPKSETVAPPLNTAMKNVMIGIDLIEEPTNDQKWAARTVEYLKDYFINPNQNKSYCEAISFNKFGTMPSMKGFMSEKQIEIISHWLVQNHRIKKDAKENYLNQYGDIIK